MHWVVQSSFSLVGGRWLHHSQLDDHLERIRALAGGGRMRRWAGLKISHTHTTPNQRYPIPTPNQTTQNQNQTSFKPNHTAPHHLEGTSPLAGAGESHNADSKPHETKPNLTSLFGSDQQLQQGTAKGISKVYEDEKRIYHPNTSGMIIVNNQMIKC